MKVNKKENSEAAKPPAAAAAAAAAAADAIINAMPDALIVLDLNGVIVNVNPAYTKIFGFKPEERVGKSFNEFGEIIKAEDIEKFMKLLGELIETGYVEPVETVIRAKDGREIPTSVTYSLLKDAEGNPKNIIALLRDITELKRAEEMKVEAEKKAARAEEAERFTKELEKKIRDLERFQKVTMDREKKVLELKEKIWELEKKLKEKK